MSDDRVALLAGQQIMPVILLKPGSQTTRMIYIAMLCINSLQPVKPLLVSYIGTGKPVVAGV
jgi:hypothetical protein